MTDERNLDVIIFGASGFTGKHTVFEAVNIFPNMRWGIAGRNKAKLEAVLAEMGRKANKDLSHIPMVIADLEDQDSLVKMARQCKVIVNCCGPYSLYGEPVIRACLEAATHHVDVSAEVNFFEEMQLKYHKAATEKGVYIIFACGFGSIPNDIGTIFLEQQFGGVVNSVESHVFPEVKGMHWIGAVNHGTWNSMVYMFANLNAMKPTRQELPTIKMPELEPKIRERFLIHKSNANKWSLPYFGPDPFCVERTQRFLYETENKRPVQMRAYISFGSIIDVIGMCLVGAIFWLLKRTSTGRNMLLNYPRVFSLGLISVEGPSDEAMRNAQFSMHFEGRGWEEKLENPTQKYAYPPNKIIRTQISAANPGYGATCVALLIAAKTILQEAGKMPGNGGVLPPGAAFAKTNIVSELCKNGFTFEVLSKQKI